MKKIGVISIRFLLLSLTVASNLLQAQTCQNNKLCLETQSCKNVRTRIDEVQTALDDCCASLTSRCQAISACVGNCDKGTAIDQDFMNNEFPQIGQPGLYCLIESVTGELGIDANDVIINMNNFVITSTAINCISAIDVDHLSILGNGVLENASNAALSLTNCTDVIVDTILFQNNNDGIQTSTVNGFVVRNSNFQNCTNNAISLNGVLNGVGRSCLIDAGSDQSVVVDASSSNISFDSVLVRGSTNDNWLVDGQNCTFLNCTAHEGTNGFTFGASASDCYCRQCNAYQNSADGFVVTGTKLILSDCLSLNNTGTGFVVNSVDSCLQNCAAKENGGNGFAVNGTQNYIHATIALANSASGYAVGGTDPVLLSNYAEANGTNYSGITDPIVTYTISNGLFSPIDFPSIWQNIDAQP